jgi:hypothetical protein
MRGSAAFRQAIACAFLLTIKRTIVLEAATQHVPFEHGNFQHRAPQIACDHPENSLEVARRRLRAAFFALHRRCMSVVAAFDLVIDRAACAQREPAKKLRMRSIA